MQAIAGMLYARASVTPKRVLRSLRTQKVLATAHQIGNSARNPRARHRPLAHQNAHLERYTGLEWHDHAKTAAVFYTRATCLNTHRRIMGSLCAQKMLATAHSARNSRARHPARPSKCTISSTVRARSGTPTPTTTEMLHMRASNTLKGLEGVLCTQKVLATAAPTRQRAQLSGAHTDRSPIQMRYLVR